MRKIRRDMVEVYKITNATKKVNGAVLLVFSHIARTRRQPMKLEDDKIDQRKYFVIQHTTILMN